MNSIIHNISVTSLLLFLSVASFAQEEEIIYEDTISVTEWLDLLANDTSKYGGIRLENTWIRFNENGLDSNFRKTLFWLSINDSTPFIVDGDFSFDSVDSTSSTTFWTEIVYDYSKYQEIDLRIDMRSCKFSGFTSLTGLNLKSIHLVNCDIDINAWETFSFKNCRMSSFLSRSCHGRSLKFENCIFSGPVRFIENKYLKVEFQNGNFEKFDLFVFNENESSGSIIFENDFTRNILFESVEFEIPDSLGVMGMAEYVPIRIENSKLDNLTLKNIDIYSLELEGSSVSKSIVFDSVEISTFIRFSKLDFSNSNTNINWNIVKGNKICYKLEKQENFKGTYPNQVGNAFQFEELLSIYQKMLNLYKERGNRKSFNACYVEMRGLQTDRLHYEYTQNKTINTLFNWRMNQFLKTFCDFGTNPVKPLIISMWVILAFGFMYFFFYNEWDKVNRQFLIKQHRKMLQYFSSEQKLEDFYTDEYMADFKSYESYKQEIDETNLHVPFFIRVLGKPLYKMSLVRFKIMTWLYRSTEVLQGKWSDLTKGRKVFVGATVSSGIVIYLVFLVAIRLLNSVVLSINTFSTLGFGDIPVKGIMKYMAILEGFLGWFLLSIFSVSLISQILPA